VTTFVSGSAPDVEHLGSYFDHSTSPSDCVVGVGSCQKSTLVTGLVFDRQQPIEILGHASSDLRQLPEQLRGSTMVLASMPPA
jgi:hypothetical protein